MDYQNLFLDLSAKPPAGWKMVHFVASQQGGVYFWPSEKSVYTESASRGRDSRLNEYAILFEFHVVHSKKSQARLLARARFYGAKPTNDKRWSAWQNFAINHCKANAPGQQGKPKTTRSLAKWQISGIDFRTSTTIAADLIRKYLSSPPSSLKCFIGHL